MGTEEFGGEPRMLAVVCTLPVNVGSVNVMRNAGKNKSILNC